MAQFFEDLNIHGAGQIQFKSSAGANAGKIDQNGNDLVITNAVGDVLLGDGSSDVYIGDGTNNVDIIFEQSGAIKGDGSSLTLTLGGSGTTLDLQNPVINGTSTVNNKMVFPTSNSYILFDYEPSGDTGEYTTEVPLIKVDLNGSESTILSRVSEYRAVALGIDDTVWLRAGDTSGVIKSNVNLAAEQVVMSAEGGFIAYGFPGNDTTWSNRVEFQFRTDSSTASDNGLYIGDGGRTQFIDLSRNLKNIGTIDSGTIEASGVVDGPFTALRLANQKTYGSSTGTNETVRFAMGISEAAAGGLDQREGFVIESFTPSATDSSNINTDFKVRDGGVIGTAVRLTGADKSVTFYGNIIKSGGTSSQFLKADGSVDSNTYLTSSSTQSKYLRSDANDIATGVIDFQGGFKPKHYGVSDDLNSDTRTIYSTHATNNATANRPINYSSVYTFGGSTSNALQISTNEDYSESGMWIRQYNANNASPQGTGWQNWTEVWTTNHAPISKISNWDTAYNNSITSAAFTGTTTKTLTLTQQDGGTITAQFTDSTGSGGDNLGNHTATTDLSMSGNSITFSTGSITSDGTTFAFDGAGGKEVLISSARDVRVVIDDNNDDTDNTFEIHKHSFGSGNELLTLNQSGNLAITGTVTANGTTLTGDQDLSGYVATSGNQTITGVKNFTGEIHWDLSAGQYAGDPRAVVMGYSGGNYGQLGYNIDFTTTAGSHTRAFNDIPTRIDLHNGIVVYAADAGSAGTSITWTEVLEAQRDAFQYKGNNIYYVGNDSGILNSNVTLASLGAAASSHEHSADEITSGTFADDRISASSVTQHTDPKYLRSDASDTTTGSLTIGDGTADTRLIIKRVDGTVADDIQFFNGTTRIGEIGTKDTTWLRINQTTAKNIYTPRYIRADAGFFVDGTSKGINGSGNFIGGTITGASDANVSNWDTAYGWGNHASAGYSTSDTVDMGSGFIVANNGGDSQFTIVEDNALRFAGTGATTVSFNATTKKVTIDSTNTTYSVGDGGLTQNNFTDADHSKLDGIAAGADVTPNWVPSSNPNYISNLDFSALLNKGSGTGDYSTSGYLEAGRGSGGVALTNNDGYGNANVTFNHVDGTPEQAGSSGRIVVTTDSTTAKMTFELKDSVTSGTAVNTPSAMEISTSGVYVVGVLNLGDSADTTLSRHSSGNVSIEGNKIWHAGGLAFGYSESGKNYPVELDGSNNAYVNVPWTNTTYSTATSSTLGLVKIGYTENGKNYPVELSSGQMFVNVPWTDTDTNTTYSAGNGITLSGTTFNADINYISYSGSNNFIDNASDQTGSEVPTGGTIIYKDTSNSEIITKALVSDLPFAAESHSHTNYITSNADDNVTGHTEWQDNYHVRLGNSADMRLYHTNGNSYIDNNTGNLYIRSNVASDVGGDIHLRPHDNENGIIIKHDAEVELYHNNALKMETTSSGVTVTGSVFASGGNVGNLNTTSDIGQQMEYGSTAVATLRFDSDRWRLYSGGAGGIGERFSVLETGNVGINDSTPSYKLDVNGTIRATGDVIAYSDERVKENIKTIDNSLEKVNKLRGVEFNKIGEDKKSIGVIAQEIEKILPEVVETDEDGMKSVAYGNVVGVLIEAIKELNKEVKELKTKLNNGDDL